MGGVVPLGYDVVDRKLVVNEAEAATVQLIFERYLALGSAIVLEADLRDRGVVSKVTVGKSGASRGGGAFTRGALYNLLQNVTYIGRVAHRGQTYAGQHEAIVAPAVFARAQALLAENRGKRMNRNHAQEVSLLAGLLNDGRGEKLTPSHTSRGPRRFRYYVGKKHGADQKRQFRVPAGEIERVVISRIAEWLNDRHAVEGAFAPHAIDAITIDAVLMTAAQCARELSDSKPSRCRELLVALVDRIEIDEQAVLIELKPHALHELAGLQALTEKIEQIRLEIGCQLVRRSKEVRLSVEPRACSPEAHADPSLVKLIVKAHAARQALLSAGGRSLADVSKAEGYEPHYFAVLVKLSYLAPDITAAILVGRQPARLNRQALARIRKLPIDWTEQRQMIGGFATLS